MSEETPQVAYRTAWEGWRKQLDQVHAVLLEGEPLHPSKLKGLLNREANAKDRYDTARRRLLGIPDPGEEE